MIIRARTLNRCVKANSIFENRQQYRQHRINSAYTKSHENEHLPDLAREYAVVSNGTIGKVETCNTTT